MGYSRKNTAKNEWKQGMDAMRAMVEDTNFDPRATLALARQGLDNFKKLDDLSERKRMRLRTVRGGSRLSARSPLLRTLGS